MKKSITLTALLALGLFAACDQEAPIEKEQYKPIFYIVGSNDKIIDKYVNIGNEQDTVNLSIAVGGSQLLSHDVTLTLEERPEQVDTYNDRELSAEGRHYNYLTPNIYEYPSDQVTVKAGNVYETFPIYIRPATLECDSLYMLSFRLKNTSDYEITDEDTVALVRLNLFNDYSGNYDMDGMLKNLENPDDSLAYKMPRTLMATNDGQTVRMFHYSNEWVEGSGIDYRQTNAFTISVNPTDNSLSMAAWDEFELVDFGGRYVPEYEVYDLWYTYMDNEVLWRAEGFLYKSRDTDAEQREIEDWIEEQRAAKQ